MRKSLIILAMLLLLSVSVLAASITVMDDQKDEITITQETVFGDPAAVDGLTVTTTIHNDYRLFWDTSYEAGIDPQAATDFRFYTKQQYEIGDGFEGSFDLQFGGVNYGMGGNLNLEEMESGQGDNWQNYYDYMLLPAIDVASRTGPGETKTEVLNLRDYYDYLRVGANYHFSGLNVHYWDESQKAVFADINDYFHIPLPDELWVEVSVTKELSGEVSNVASWDAGSGYYDPESGEAPLVDEDYEPWSAYSHSICTEDGVFLTLGGSADFSQVKGGFGVYFLPIGTEWEVSYLDTKHIENIYPMDRAVVEETSLLRSLDGTRLYLLTREGEEHYLTALDCKTREEVQRIPLGELKAMPTVWMEENVVALLSGDYESGDYTLQVFEHRDGKLSLWLEAPMYPLNDAEDWYYDPELLFDGQTLVIGCFHRSWDTASHRILLYDETGLQYAGDYLSTADELPDRLLTENPGGMTLQWNS